MNLVFNKGFNVLLFQIALILGSQSNALVVNCKNIICSDHAKVYYLGTLGPLSRSNKNKYWSSSNDEYAIWFDENFENWKIGLAKNRGTSKCAMYSIDQNHEDDTTSPVGKSWMYWNGQIWVKDEDIKVEKDPGKIYLCHLYFIKVCT